MNKIFKSFFNSNTGCFVVTSEAKSYASKGFKKQISSAIIVSALLTLSAGSFAEDYQNASNARVIGSFSSGQITFFDSNKTVNIKNLPNWNTDLTTQEGLNNRFHVDGNGNVLLTPYEPDSQILNPKISDFGAVDDEGKRSISLWHKQTPGIPGVDFYLERLYNILQT